EEVVPPARPGLVHPGGRQLTVPVLVPGQGAVPAVVLVLVQDEDAALRAGDDPDVGPGVPLVHRQLDLVIRPPPVGDLVLVDPGQVRPVGVHRVLARVGALRAQPARAVVLVVDPPDRDDLPPLAGVSAGRCHQLGAARVLGDGQVGRGHGREGLTRLDAEANLGAGIVDCSWGPRAFGQCGGLVIYGHFWLVPPLWSLISCREFPSAAGWRRTRPG